MSGKDRRSLVETAFLKKDLHQVYTMQIQMYSVGRILFYFILTNFRRQFEQYC